MSVEIQVSAQQALTHALESYLEQYPWAVASAMKTVADRILDTSNVLVPVRTGFLKSTLGYRQDSNFQFVFYATAPYAGYVEFGTSRMAARLFLTRAIEQHKPEFKQEVESVLGQLRDNFFIP